MISVFDTIGSDRLLRKYEFWEEERQKRKSLFLLYAASYSCFPSFIDHSAAAAAAALNH